MSALFVAAVATTSTAPPAAAQTFSPRDSAALAKVGSAKAVADSLATLSTPTVTQMCGSGFKGAGYFKNGACKWNDPLTTRLSAGIADLAKLLSVPNPASGTVRVDTVKIASKPDTIRVTKTVTVHDTIRVASKPDTVTVTKTVIKTVHDTVTITKTNTIHDTVFVTQLPPPPVVATVSTSLGDRSLEPGQTTQARATIKDSSGAALAKSVVWTSTAPSVAVVSDSGLVTAVSPGSSAITANVDSKKSYATVTVAIPPDTTTPPPPVTPPVTPPVVVPPPTNDTSKKGVVLAFTGPTIPPSGIPAQFAFYEKNFKSNSDQQWTDFGPRWDAGNSISGYERAAIYYIWWARTGDATYLDRAHQTAVNYRDNAVIPGGYAVSPHWSQMESMYLDCVVAKDQKSCQVLPEVASRLAAFPPSSYFDLSQGEARIQARVIMALWMYEKYSGQHSDLLDQAILKALSVMNANGYAPFQSTCGGSLNYMQGMLYDVLTRLHDQRPMAIYNTLIETKAKAFYTWAWNTQWRGGLSAGPDDQSFNYVSVYCEGTGSQTGAPDLNGLMLPGFGWLGKTTGDVSWFVKGDQILSGMQGASVYLYRQFSESYSSSFRYLGYRWPASALKTTAPVTIAARTAMRAAPKLSAAELTRMAADAKRTRALEAAQHDSLIVQRSQKQ